MSFLKAGVKPSECKIFYVVQFFDISRRKDFDLRGKNGKAICTVASQLIAGYWKKRLPFTFYSMA